MVVKLDSCQIVEVIQIKIGLQQKVSQNK